MFTELDYLVQVERHKDYVAHAEQHRIGEALLSPNGARRGFGWWLVRNFLAVTCRWGRWVKAPAPPLRKTGMQST